MAEGGMSDSAFLALFWEMGTGGLAGVLEGVANGGLLALIGLAIQLKMRGQWPTGNLNEGDPKRTIDPHALWAALVAAVVVGIVAMVILKLKITPPADGASPLPLFANLLLVVALGYVAADFGPPIERLLSRILAKLGSGSGEERK